MKNMSLLVWITQLGLSVAAPLVGFILLGVWLHQRFAWGSWVIWVGVILGISSAIGGLRSSLAFAARLSDPKNDEPPTVAFDDHD